MKPVFPGFTRIIVLAIGCFVLPGLAVAHFPDEPAKEKIVFTFVPSPEKLDTVGIGVMNADGSDRVILAKGPVAEMMAPTLSPDGKTIAFAILNKEKKTSDIFLMNRDGSSRKRLTSQDEKTYATAPAWSADGKRIAFQICKGTLIESDGRSKVYSDSQEIAVMDADGKNLKILGKGAHPSWSPDGKKLLYVVVNEKLNFHLWCMDADGKNPSRVVKEETYRGDWSPDGKRIAFIPKKEDSLYICKPDGSELKVVLKGEEAAVMGFAWSADGKRFYINRVPDLNKLSAPIFVVDIDGSNLKQITKGEQMDVFERFDGITFAGAAVKPK